MRSIQDCRLTLRERIIAATGIPNLYFQPPESMKIKYPCIVYSLSNLDAKHADNLPYLVHPRFDLTLIDKDPDSKYVTLLAGMAKCKMHRVYSADNLNHWTFTTYE